MIHYMKLQDKPFRSIKSGSKTVEMRLNDEKRRLLNVGDFILFTNIVSGEEIEVKIVDLIRFSNFGELYNNFDKVSLGYDISEEANSSDMDIFYSKEEQDKYGVLAIKIERK